MHLRSHWKPRWHSRRCECTEGGRRGSNLRLESGAARCAQLVAASLSCLRLEVISRLIFCEGETRPAFDPRTTLQTDVWIAQEKAHRKEVKRIKRKMKEVRKAAREVQKAIASTGPSGMTAQRTKVIDTFDAQMLHCPDQYHDFRAPGATQRCGQTVQVFSERWAEA